MANFLTKVAQIFSELMYYFEKISSQVKTPVFSFGLLFVKFGLLFIPTSGHTAHGYFFNIWPIKSYIKLRKKLSIIVADSL